MHGPSKASLLHFFPFFLFGIFSSYFPHYTLSQPFLSPCRLPSRGSPITSIDVTDDGTLVLCTTKTFLLVFPTMVPETGKSGFDKSMGKYKPQQIQLRLSFEDVKQLGGEVGI